MSDGDVRDMQDGYTSRVLDGARMVEGGAREEDAFERAAAELRPDWASVVEAPAAMPARAAAAAPASSVVAAEPSVIVQPDIAVHGERAAARSDDGAALADGPQLRASSAPPSGVVASGFGVPSAFGSSPNVIAPSSSARHEATVVTRALPASFRALDRDSSAELADGSLSSVSKRKRQLRLAAVVGAACLLFGGLVAWLSRDSNAPIASAPPAAPVVVAPVVQPLPEVAPAKPAPTRIAEPARPSAVAVPIRAVSQPARPVAPAPIVKKKAVTPVRTAKPSAVKPAAKVVPAKGAVTKGAATKTTPAKLGKAPAKAGAKNKPQPAGSKRQLSPVDVLNPWAH
ncbi:MAG: hypothetical protein JWN48_680 [Myxococcaceae bacterium]|nr:hypothetical protein [Myxococcaceae bacterium]